MAASPARAAAFEILLRVELEEAFASELLYSQGAERLTAVDHSLATEIVMGVLRWRSLLDQRLERISSRGLERLDGEVRTALRMGVYQMQFLSKVPARAAVHESVELVKAAHKRSAAPFVNAVLRKIGGTPPPRIEIAGVGDAKTLAEASAHPEWLVDRWTGRYGLDTARRICQHDQIVPDTAIHVDNEAAAELARPGVQLEPGLLLSSARRVRSGDVTKSEAYGEGRVAIQDEASQLVALLLGHGKAILDCCAAPGGKTLLIAKRNQQVNVFASELHNRRAQLLGRRVRLPNVQVLAADARRLPFGDNFDRILADVPCSGTGTLARNPEIKWRLHSDDLFDLQKRQAAILRSALTHLAPGGRLIYSTCSLEGEENEAVVEGALAESSAVRVVDIRGELNQLREEGELAWSDMDSLIAGSYLRTIPGVHPCDGFFVAMLERIQ